MKFLQPDILFQLVWILPVAAVLIYFAFARRKKVLDQFLGSEMRDRLSSNVCPRKRIYKQICFLMGVILLAVAAARPGWGTKLVEEPVQSRDIMIVLDTSRSMLADDIKLTRLAHAKWWIRDLIKKSEGDRFGLICFAGMAEQNCPLTMEPDTFFSFLDDIDTETIPMGGTNVQLALEKAVESFKGAEGEHKAIVLLTDGDELDGESASILEKLKSTNIPVHVVGIGDPDGPGIIILPNGNYLRDGNNDIVKSKLNEDGLKAVATATNGTYVRTTNLDSGVEAINARLEELIPEGTKKVKKERIIERYQFPLLGAIIFFMLQMLIRERKKEAVKIAALLMCVALLLSNKASAADTGNLLTAKDGKKMKKKAEPQQVIIPEIKAIEKLITAENDKAKPNRVLLSRLNYNLGVISQQNNLFNEAKDAYADATGSPEPEIKSRAFQNLAALKHLQAQQKIKDDTDDAISGLNDVIPDYREALKADPKNREAANNLEKLYSHITRAKQIKKLKEEMEKLKKQTQDKTKDAQDKQQKAMDEKKQQEQKSQQDQKQQGDKSQQDQKQKQDQKSQQDKKQQGDKSQQQDQKNQEQKGDKSQQNQQGQKSPKDQNKQEQKSSKDPKGDKSQQGPNQSQQQDQSQQGQQSQANDATKDASESAQKLRDLANELKSKDAGKFKDAADELDKAAQKQDFLDNLSEDQQKKSKEEIMDHLKKAMKKMAEAKGDKKKDDSKDKKDSKDSEKQDGDSSGEEGDKKDAKDGDKKDSKDQKKDGDPSEDESKKKGKRKKGSKEEVDRLLREASMNEEQLRKLMKLRDKELKRKVLRGVKKNW